MMSTGRTRPWGGPAILRRMAAVRRDLAEWAVPAACGALIGVLLDGLNRLINAMG